MLQARLFNGNSAWRRYVRRLLRQQADDVAIDVAIDVPQHLAERESQHLAERESLDVADVERSVRRAEALGYRCDDRGKDPGDRVLERDAVPRRWALLPRCRSP